MEEYVEFYNDFFFSLFDTTVTLYKDNYQLFSNPQVMAAKITFDSFCYFTALGSPFVHGKLTKKEDIEELQPTPSPSSSCFQHMQGFFKDWNELDSRQWEGESLLSKEFEPYITAQGQIGWDAEGDEMLDRVRENIEVIKAFAVWLFHTAGKHLPEPPDPDKAVDPLKVSLKPDQWEADGLFTDDGLTLAQALEKLPGVEEIDLEARGAVQAG